MDYLYADRVTLERVRWIMITVGVLLLVFGGRHLVVELQAAVQGTGNWTEPLGALLLIVVWTGSFALLYRIFRAETQGALQPSEPTPRPEWSLTLTGRPAVEPLIESGLSQHQTAGVLDLFETAGYQAKPAPDGPGLLRLEHPDAEVPVHLDVIADPVNGLERFLPLLWRTIRHRQLVYLVAGAERRETEPLLAETAAVLGMHVWFLDVSGQTLTDQPRRLLKP